jgi:hypothetical protein
MTPYELRQHIGWLTIYAEDMNGRNWKDMRARIINQIRMMHMMQYQSQGITGASSFIEEAACLIWSELCPGMVMSDDDLPHYEAAAKAVLSLIQNNSKTASTDRT